METQLILTERNVVVEVLEKYRQLPYLWNPTHKLYTNKNARRQGLEILLQGWKKLEPNATIDCIRKKLNNWRAAYRRERKKVDDSMLTASEPDEYHKPNLWYYDYLTFLHDDCPVLSKDDDDGVDNEIQGDHVEVTVAELVNARIDESNDQEDSDNNVDDDNDEDEDETDEEPLKKPRVSSNRKDNDRSSIQDQDTSQNASHLNDESSADLFGRAIGSQLKEVTKFQRCLAEKLISEVMFYAKLEQLTIGTSVNLESHDT